MPSPLTALSPLDGRYATRVRALQERFSELALIRERVAIEVEWLLALAAEPSFTALAPFSAKAVKELKSAAQKFSLADAERSTGAVDPNWIASAEPFGPRFQVWTAPGAVMRARCWAAPACSISS